MDSRHSADQRADRLIAAMTLEKMAGQLSQQFMYEFGLGLSYTRFDIGTPTVDNGEIAPGGRIVVSTTVTNTGERA